MFIYIYFSKLLWQTNKLQINQRLYSLSSNKTAFDQAPPPYISEISRRKWIPVYIILRTNKANQTKKKQTTKRHPVVQPSIYWFSKNVNTNTGQTFLVLVDKHFPKGHKLRKIFNRNTIKISYSCINNTKQIIDNHNKSAY